MEALFFWTGVAVWVIASFWVANLIYTRISERREQPDREPTAAEVLELMTPVDTLPPPMQGVDRYSCFCRIGQALNDGSLLMHDEIVVYCYEDCKWREAISNLGRSHHYSPGPVSSFSPTHWVRC